MAVRKLLPSVPHRSLSPASLRSYGPLFTGTRLSSSSAPATIAHRDFWRSLVPRPLRRENRETKNASGFLRNLRTKPWNPATFFIVMFILIGSMAIQMIALRHSFERYLRQSTVRIAQLKDIVERIQKGEDVDVEKALGTGEPQKEAEWDEILQAIESEDTAMKVKKPRRPKKSATDLPDDMSTVAEKHTPGSPDQPSSASETVKMKTASVGNFF